MVRLGSTKRTFGCCCRVVGVALLVGVGGGTALAAGPVDITVDATTLAQMEQRAATADIRDRCYLYTEVIQGLTNLAGREMAAGDEDQAIATMTHADELAAKVHEATVANAKQLQKAEEMMDRTTRHLADMVRVASEQQRNTMQHALEHLNAVHSDMLAVVFAK